MSGARARGVHITASHSPGPGLPGRLVCAPQEDVPELGSLALSRYAGPHALLGCGWFVPHPLWWAPLPPTTLPAWGQPGHFFPVKGSSLVRTWCVHVSLHPHKKPLWFFKYTHLVLSVKGRVAVLGAFLCGQQNGDTCSSFTLSVVLPDGPQCASSLRKPNVHSWCFSVVLSCSIFSSLLHSYFLLASLVVIRPTSWHLCLDNWFSVLFLYTHVHLKLSIAPQA